MARPRKPLTRRGVAARLLIGLAIAVAACPVWYGLNGRWLFPTGQYGVVGVAMGIYPGPDGAEIIRLGGFSFDNLVPREIGGERPHTILRVAVDISPPSPRTERVFGAPIRIPIGLACTAFVQERSPATGESDRLLDYWHDFALRLETASRLDRPAELRDDGTVAYAPMSTTVVARKLQQALRSNGEKFQSSGVRINSDHKYIYWPAAKWAGARVALALLCLAALGYTLPIASRALRLDWRNPPWCPRCRYPLDPAMPRCPECGMAIRWPGTA